MRQYDNDKYKGEPTTEYLDDEVSFDNGVYTYHILNVKDLQYNTKIVNAP